MGLFGNKKVAEENEFEGAVKGKRQEDSHRRIVQARTARGFIQGTHPCHSSQAETCQEHQRNDKGDAKRNERGNRTLNKHFVKAA